LRERKEALGSPVNKVDHDYSYRSTLNSRLEGALYKLH